MQISVFPTPYGNISLVDRSISVLIDTNLNRKQNPDFDPEPLRELMRQTVALRHDLARIRQDFKTLSKRIGGASGDTSSVKSANGLGLNLTESAATLNSSEEVNTVASSFTPFGPSFVGESTTVVTLGGVYNGSEGDNVLTFHEDKDGIVGINDVKFKILNEDGDTVDSVQIDKELPPDTPVLIEGIGLTISLSFGVLLKDDSFQVAVYSTVGSAVDPDKAFDGIRNDQPNFEPGLAVTAGSFDVNGVNISVAADDTINSVLDRINQSAAGVTAVFNATTETIDITSNTIGSSGQIVLENDTSGFLAATKLDGAAVQPGVDSDLNKPMENVAALAQINLGDFIINETVINVDPSVDSLSDVLERINQSVTGVTASYNATTDTVSIKSISGGLTIDNGSSGLFDALGIESGNIILAGGSNNSVLSSSSPNAVLEQLDAITQGLNRFSSAARHGEIRKAKLDPLEKLWTVIENAVTPRAAKVNGTASGPLALFGLEFSRFSEDGLVSIDNTLASKAVRYDGRSFFEFFLTDTAGGESGFFDQLNDALRAQQQTLLYKMAEAGIHTFDFQV